MSNQSGNAQNNMPLFQNMDEQEQVYAPQQVPGAAMPAEEVDQGATAGATNDAGAGPADHTPVVPAAGLAAAGLAAGPNVGLSAAAPAGGAAIGAAALDADTKPNNENTDPS